MTINSEPRRDPEKIEQTYLDQYMGQLGGRVLDIGCGDGRLARFLANKAGHVVSIDPDRKELGIGHKTFKKAEPIKFSFAAAQGESIPFANETFTQAIFSWSL